MPPWCLRLFFQLPQPRGARCLLCVQPVICKRALSTLLSFVTDNTFPNIRDTASRIIKNISYHPDNRTPLYATELAVRSEELKMELGMSSSAQTLRPITAESTFMTTLRSDSSMQGSASGSLGGRQPAPVRPLHDRMCSAFAGAMGPPAPVFGDEKRKPCPIEMPASNPPVRKSKLRNLPLAATSFEPAGPESDGYVHVVNAVVVENTSGSVPEDSACAAVYDVLCGCSDLHTALP